MAQNHLKIVQAGDSVNFTCILPNNLRSSVVWVRQRVGEKPLLIASSFQALPFKFENDKDDHEKTQKHNFQPIKWGVPGTAAAVASSKIFDIVKSKFVFPNTRTDEHYAAWLECIVQADVLLSKDSLANGLGSSVSGGGSGAAGDWAAAAHQCG